MRILVSDEYTLFRAVLCQLLDRLDVPHECCETESFGDLIARLKQEEAYDLVLIDHLGDNIDTFDRVQKVCKAAGNAPVVVITAMTRDRDVHRAVRAGAAGFVPKSSKPDLLIGALKQVLSGGIYIPASVMHLTDPLDAKKSCKNGRVRSTAAGRSLTSRQSEVMALVAQGRTNKDIAGDLQLSPATVKVHVSNIFKALNVHNRTEAVFAIRNAALLDS